MFSTQSRDSWVVKGASIISLFVLVVSSSPKLALAASVLSESFGTGSTSGTVSGWTEGGGGAEVRDDGSGNDSPSPDGGRFAVIFGTDGSICRTITTAGITNVKLSYYWRGDSDANNPSDNGIVEFKAGSSCSGSGWTQLRDHDLQIDNSWTTQSAFTNAGFNNTTFVLRFRTDTNQSDEHFRVDGISITGDAADTTAPTVTGLSNDSTPKKTKTWSWGANETATYRFVIDQNAGGTPSGSYGSTNSASQNSGNGTYYIHVQAQDTAGNESAVVTVSAVLDNTAPTLAQFTPVTTPTKDTTPDYEFTSTEAGTISTTGGCNVSGSAVVGNNTKTFNTLAQGTYNNCTINVTDAAGNASSQLSVSTFVIDTTLPSITIIGNNPAAATTGESYTDAGATASDNVSGTLPVTTTGGVNTSTPGTYTITYSATDAAGNTKTVQRAVNVSDNDAPEFASLSDITAEATSIAGAIISYVLPVATDNVDLDVSGATACVPGSGSMFAIGETIVSCTTQDSAHNIGNGSFKVIVVDSTVPTIAIDPTTQTVEAVDATGAPATLTIIANDNIDGDLSASAACSHASGGVFPFGDTTVNCSVTDAHGNSASAGAHVTVVDSTKPVITLVGDNEVTLFVTGSYSDAGATADDSVDGSLPVITGGSVDTLHAGTYTIVYDATDSHGNAATQVTRTVIVKNAGNGPISGSLGGQVLGASTFIGGSNGPVAGENPTTTKKTEPATTTTVATEQETTGAVLGASCSPLFTSFIGFGKDTSEDVKKLQEFLNKEMNLTLSVNGIFDAATKDAVKSFQLKYAQEVLAPWVPFGLSIDTPTGIVYKTTLRMINMLSCEGLVIPMPELN